MINYPCKDCLDRCIGCHGTCTKYKNVNIENKKEKDFIRQNSIADEIKFNSIFRSCDLRDKKNIKV